MTIQEAIEFADALYEWIKSVQQQYTIVSRDDVRTFVIMYFVKRID